MNTELHVIFGTGPLGQAVMRELLKRHRNIRMINRSGQAEVPANVEVVQADVYNQQSAIAASAGATVIYQCAQPGYTEWVEKFPPLQASILNAAIHHQVRFVVGDNLYMYGAVAGDIHENLPNNAHTRKGKVRAEMAQTVLDAHQQGKVQAALVRASDFYGKGVLGSAVGEYVFPAVLKGKAVQAMGDIDQPHSYTFIDDFGKAMVIVGEHEDAMGQIWHAPNAETLTTREFITKAYNQVDHTPKFRAMGKSMARIVGLFVPEVREMIEMLYEFEQEFVVDDSKFVEKFGNCATPIDEAIAQTLDWYRAHLNGHPA